MYLYWPTRLDVEGQWSGDVVSYFHHLGAACQKVQDPGAQGGVKTQNLELNEEFGGYYGVKCWAVVTLTIHSCTYYLNLADQPVLPHIG